MSGTANLSPQRKLLNVTPVVLAGGMGKRLWPITTPLRPKPFVRLPYTNSLFQDTLERLQGMNPPVIVCYAPFAGTVFEQCYELGIKPKAIICEPAQRGTAAAIACAALYLKNQDTQMLVTPSDHRMDVALTDIVADVPKDEEFTLFGVMPSALAERFGYIVLGQNGALVRFVEKPTKAQIELLAQEGRVFWNTGIFMSRPDVFLQRLQNLHPDFVATAQKSFDSARRDGVFVFPDIESFVEMRSMAVDYGLMEHLRQANVVPLDVEWGDCGTLSSFFHIQALKISKCLRSVR